MYWSNLQLLHTELLTFLNISVSETMKFQLRFRKAQHVALTVFKCCTLLVAEQLWCDYIMRATFWRHFSVEGKTNRSRSAGKGTVVRDRKLDWFLSGNREVLFLCSDRLLKKKEWSSTQDETGRDKQWGKMYLSNFPKLNSNRTSTRSKPKRRASYLL